MAVRKKAPDGPRARALCFPLKARKGLLSLGAGFRGVRGVSVGGPACSSVQWAYQAVPGADPFPGAGFQTKRKVIAFSWGRERRRKRRFPEGRKPIQPRAPFPQAYTLVLDR